MYQELNPTLLLKHVRHLENSDLLEHYYDWCIRTIAMLNVRNFPSRRANPEVLIQSLELLSASHPER